MDIAINALKLQRERLAAEKKRVRKELKNAQKKRSRLKKKASGLSNNDLFDIMRLRDLPGAQPPPADANAADAGGNDNGQPQAGAGAPMLHRCVHFCGVCFSADFWPQGKGQVVMGAESPGLIARSSGEYGSRAPLANAHLFPSPRFSLVFTFDGEPKLYDNR